MISIWWQYQLSCNMTLCQNLDTRPPAFMVNNKYNILTVQLCFSPRDLKQPWRLLNSSLPLIRNLSTIWSCIDFQNWKPWVDKGSWFLMAISPSLCKTWIPLYSRPHKRHPLERNSKKYVWWCPQGILRPKNRSGSWSLAKECVLELDPMWIFNLFFNIKAGGTVSRFW